MALEDHINETAKHTKKLFKEVMDINPPSFSEVGQLLKEQYLDVVEFFTDHKARKAKAQAGKAARQAVKKTLMEKHDLGRVVAGVLSRFYSAPSANEHAERLRVMGVSFMAGWMPNRYMKYVTEITHIPENTIRLNSIYLEMYLLLPTVVSLVAEQALANKVADYFDTNTFWLNATYIAGTAFKAAQPFMRWGYYQRTGKHLPMLTEVYTIPGRFYTPLFFASDWALKGKEWAARVFSKEKGTPQGQAQNDGFSAPLSPPDKFRIYSD